MSTADNMAEALRMLAAEQQTEDDQYWDPIDQMLDEFDLSYCPVMAEQKNSEKEDL